MILKIKTNNKKRTIGNKKPIALYMLIATYKDTIGIFDVYAYGILFLNNCLC
jgi:hypothetical protein